MGWLYGIILAALLALSAVGGYKKGSGDVQAKWDKQTLADSKATNAAMGERNQEIVATKAQYEEDKKLLKKGYSNEIDIIHAGYAKSGRLLFGQGTCQRLTSVTQTPGPGGSDGGNAETWGFSPEVEQGIKSLGQEIEEKFASCRVAQDFIRKNGMAP